MAIPEISQAGNRFAHPRSRCRDARLGAHERCDPIDPSTTSSSSRDASTVRIMAIQLQTGQGLSDVVQATATSPRKNGVKVGEVGSSRHRSAADRECLRQDDGVQVLPKIDAFAEDGSTGEEVKTVQESRKILGIADLDVAATCVRVPIPVGHSVSLLARFSRAITAEEARALLQEAPGVELRDDPANGIYPSPLEPAGRDEVLVGRIRRAPGHDDSLLLFACGDNLRKGAALNGIQIAERLFSTA